MGTLVWWQVRQLIAVRANVNTKNQVPSERDFFIDNLLVRIHFIIVMIR